MTKRHEPNLENLIIGNRPIRCGDCRGRMLYVGGGKYECEDCQAQTLDDFGKVKSFLEEYGPMPIFAISEATGVDKDVIEGFLRKGRVEIPEGSRFFLHCEKCGCDIRCGRFCPDCIRAFTKGAAAVFNEDVGEKPKKPKLSGKMHYFSDRK